MRRVLLVLLLSCIIMAGVPFGRAQADYVPGVKPGDAISYDQVSASWAGNLPPQSPTADFLNVSSIQNTITSVSQNNVTLAQIKTYNNGSMTSSHLLYNVQSGYGNYTPAFPWVSAMGLAAPEAAYETPQAPAITSTVEKVYLGNVRTINVITQFQVLSGGYLSSELDFDQRTGILLYLTYTLVYSNTYYVTAHLSILITQTSLWSPPLQPDFAILANPFTAVVLKGSSVNSTITLQSLNGFQGTPSLSATITPIGPSVTLNQTTRTILMGASANVLLNFSATPPVTAGIYGVTVTATVGSVSHSTVLNFTVIGPSYSLSPAQAYIAIPTNSSGTDPVTLTSLGRFNGTVTLMAVALANGPVPGLNPSTIAVKAGTNTTTLTITTHLVPAGFYTLKINGTGPLVQPVYVYLQVLPGPPDFTISLNPALASYDLTSGTIMTHIILTSVYGFVGVVNLNLYWINGSQTTFLGLSNPYLSAYGSTSIQLKVFGPPISIGCCGILQVTGTSGSLSHSANFTVYVPPGPDFTVAITPASADVPQGVTVTANVTMTNTSTITGPIELIPSLMGGCCIGFSVSPSIVVLAPGASSTVILRISPNPPSIGTYNFTVSVSSIGHSHSVRFALKVLSPSAGFTIISSPGSLSVKSGTSAFPSIVVTSVGNFYANVSLSASAASSGLLLSWTDQKIQLGPNATVSTSLSVTAPVSMNSGTYSVTITASGNGVVHTLTISVQVLGLPDFAITIAPGQVSTQAGQTAKATITITGVNNFNGTVNLSGPATSRGLTLNLSTQTVVLSYLAPSNTANLTITMPANLAAGTYTITITATNGTTTRQASILVTVTPSSGTQPPNGGAFSAPLEIALGLLVVLMAGLAALFIIIRRRPKQAPQAGLSQ